MALGERVVVELTDAPPRTGQLVEVSETTAVVQVLEDTVGLSPGRATITLTGEVPTAAVGTELVGRVLSGGGRALDGLPDPVGEALLPLSGAALNPIGWNQTADVTFVVPDEPGTYDYWCRPHMLMMRGKIVVQD